MPRSPRTAADRLASHHERLVNAWIPADLLVKLDRKLALQWAARPSDRRPSRQAFFVDAIRKFVEDATNTTP